LQARSSEGIEGLLSALLHSFDPDCDVVVEPYLPAIGELWPDPEQASKKPRWSAWRIGERDEHAVRVMVSWTPDRIAGPVLAQIVAEWLRGRQARGPAIAAFYGPDGHLLDTMSVGKK
jgi:hypothetical protein